MHDCHLFSWGNLLRAYLDESGTHGTQSPVTVMACFVASDEQWDAFETSISDLLAEHQVERFHAIELRRREGVFKNWDRTSVARFTSKVLSITDTHLAFGFVVVLVNRDFNECYRNQVPRGVCLDTKLGLCYRLSMMQARAYMGDHAPNKAPISIVLEDGAKNLGDVRRVHNDLLREEGIRAQYRGMIGGLSIAKKRDCKQLAAADMLAYWSFRKEAKFQKSHAEHFIPVGPADPPYAIPQGKIKRIEFSRETLAKLRDEAVHQTLGARMFKP